MSGLIPHYLGPFDRHHLGRDGVLMSPGQRLA